MSLQQVLLVALLLLPIAAPSHASDGTPNRPPNIVLIIGDDLGYSYQGFMGNPVVATPNLDALAREGTTFTRAYSPASVCRPALQTLLSGIHPREWVAQELRLEADQGAPLPPRSEVAHYTTLARQLGRQGYKTFQGGKHWEGNFASAGFDAGTTDVFDPIAFLSPDWFDFARRSLTALHDFMDGVDDDESFFLFLAPMLPHTPHDAPFRILQRYQGRGFSQAAVQYYANTTRFDETVGQLVEALDQRGLRDDTLIIYLSDNGWQQGAFDPPYFLGDSLGGDRGKLSAYDLGFRTPVIFNWPGEVPAGAVFSDFIGFEDVHATIMDYAGAPIPPDHAGDTLMPRIRGFGEPKREFIAGVQDIFRVREDEFVPPFIVKFESASFLRTDQWHYIEWLDRGEQELYRINQDPLERFNLAGGQPGLLSEFSALSAAWRDELTEPAPWIDVMGQLRDATGTPAPGLRLWLIPHRASKFGATMEVFSDDRGYFRFPNVPADQYTLRYEIETASDTRMKHAWSSPRRQRTHQIYANLTDFQTGPFLSLEVPGEIEARAESDSRAATLEVELHPREGAIATGLPVTVSGWGARGMLQQRVLSGPDGFVALDQMPAGFYFVRVDAERGSIAQPKWIYLEAGSSKHVEIDIRKMRRFRDARKDKSRSRS